MTATVISPTALRDYMVARGETCASLAEKVGCHRSLIGHLRCGFRRTCTTDTATRVERALQAPPASLFMERRPRLAGTR